MALEILNIKNAGEKGSEALRLEVIQECDLRDFAVADLTFDAKGEESNIYRHFFRFPHLIVKKGDRILLHTKSGKYHTYLTGDKTLVHHVYWGSNSTIWNQDGDSVELFRLRRIDSLSV